MYLRACISVLDLNLYFLLHYVNFRVLRLSLAVHLVSEPKLFLFSLSFFGNIQGDLYRLFGFDLQYTGAFFFLPFSMVADFYWFFLISVSVHLLLNQY